MLNITISLDDYFILYERRGRDFITIDAGLANQIKAQSNFDKEVFLEPIDNSEVLPDGSIFRKETICWRLWRLETWQNKQANDFTPEAKQGRAKQEREINSYIHDKIESWKAGVREMLGKNPKASRAIIEKLISRAMNPEIRITSIPQDDGTTVNIEDKSDFEVQRKLKYPTEFINKMKGEGV